MMNDERNCVEALVEDASDTCTVHGRVRIRRHGKEALEGSGMQSLLPDLGPKAEVSTWTDSTSAKQLLPDEACGKQGTWT